MFELNSLVTSFVRFDYFGLLCCLSKIFKALSDYLENAMGSALRMIRIF